MMPIYNKVITFILVPIRKSPIAFLFYGFLLFLPELFLLMSWERGVYIAEHFFTTIAFSYMVSWTICAIALCFKKYDWIWHGTMHTLVAMMALTDIVIFKFFRIRLGYTAFQLLLQTNGGETKEFFEAYLSNEEFLLFLAIILLILLIEMVGVLWLRKLYVSIFKILRKDGWIILLFIISSINLLNFFFPTFVSGRIHICTPDAPALGNHVMWHIKNGTENVLSGLMKDADKLEIYLDSLKYKPIVLFMKEFEEPSPDNIVLIIGETYNKYHTPFYGYMLETTPRQKTYNPIVFNNVITPISSTQEAFRAILSVNSAHDTWTEAPLFPALFKGSGWNVAFYSNQFTKITAAHTGILDFMVDAILSRPKVDKACFSFHNKDRFDMDGPFVDLFLKERDLFEKDRNNLTIVHFMGQHMSYDCRYPPEEGHFTKDSIQRPELSEAGLTEVMHYDNAVYYNDQQIGRILEAYKNKDAIIIATADHGEEIYDFRPHSGRSFLKKDDPVALIKTHVDVPFLVFATDKYKENHPKTMALLDEAKSRPFMIDNLTHFLLSLGGIQTSWYDCTKNPLHPDYDTLQHRILLVDDIDYDERCNCEMKIGY